MSEYVGVSQAMLNKLLKGKTITLKPDSHDEVVIELVFDNPKIYKRYVKNSSMGKGTRVELIDFEEINDHEGGSIFTKMGKSLKQFGNSVRKNGLVRDIGKASLIAGATAAGSMLGGPMGGITAGVLAERGSSHMGLGVK